MRSFPPLLALLAALLLAAPALAAGPHGAEGPKARVLAASAGEGNATLVVVVNATGGDLALPFDAAGSGLPASFSVQTAGGVGSAAFANLAGANASLQPLLPPSGWRLRHAACDAGAPANVTLTQNATSTCWFDLLKLASLVVTVRSAGGDAAFPFQATGAGLPASFTVNATNGTGALAFADLEPGAARSLAPAPPAGWTLAASACTTGAPTGFTPAAGQTVACVFDLVRVPAFTTRVLARGGDGAFSFEPAAPGLFPEGFQVATENGTGAATRSDLEWNRTYGLRHAVPAGWKLHNATCDAGRPDNFTLPPGSGFACTYRYTKLGEVRVRLLTHGGDGAFGLLAAGNSSLPARSTVATSAGAGGVSFSDVDPDSVATLAVEVPSGWRLTASTCTVGTPAALAPPAGGNATCMFELTRLAELRGAVYHDRDRDGARDGGEEGLAGLVLFLDHDDDRTIDASEATAVTDATGAYVFRDILPGWARVRETVPTGWTATAPSNATRLVGLAPGALATGVDFGNARAAGRDGKDRDDRDEDDDRDERWSGPGYWRGALRDAAAWDARVGAISGSSAWLMPAGYSADASGARWLLHDATKHCERDLGKLGCARLKFEARLLVLRLNLAASEADWSEVQEVHASREARAYLGLGETATWRQIVDAIEAKAGTQPTREQYQWLRQVAQSTRDGGD